MRSRGWALQGETLSLTLLRLILGMILIVHGANKLANPENTAEGFSAMGVPMPEVAVYLAVAGELFAGLGLLFGLLTRIAALGPVLTMIFAIGFAHLGKGLLAENGGWEYPLLLLVVSLYFVFRGPGGFSVDALIHRMREEKAPQRARTGTLRERPEPSLAAETIHRSL